MKRRAVGVLVAVAMTLVGTLMLVSYVRGAENRAVAGEKLVDVLVVAQPVKKGTAASTLSGKVKLERVPARVRPKTAVTSLASLRGLVTTADLALGEALVTGRFGKPNSLDVQGSIDTTNLVKVAATFDLQRALNGQIKLGDTVAAVISSEKDGERVTKVVLHQLPVVAVTGAVVTTSDEEEDAKASAGGNAGGKVSVTLAMTEAQAGQFIWGMEHGSIWLALEPAKADQSGTGTVKVGDVLP
jgi:pilus assembly protein CpaB